MIFDFFHLLLCSLLISFGCSVILRTGQPVCVPSAGIANVAHCLQIIEKQMPERRPARDARYIFSHGQREDCTGSLPVYLRRKNCVIIVNTLGNSLTVSGDWSTLRHQATRLVGTCVMTDNGAGGHIQMPNGLFLAVWKPASYVAMAETTGGFIPQCMRDVGTSSSNWNSVISSKLRRRNETSGTD